MKKKIFSFLLASLATLAVSAQWTRPTAPVLSPASDMVPAEEKGVGDTYYLWNEEGKAFLGETPIGGNDHWKVRTAARTDKGLEIYFQKYKLNGVWQEGNYYLRTYTVANQSGRWDLMWIPLSNNDICYSDYEEPGQNRGYGDGAPLWNVELNGAALRVKTGTLQPVWNFQEQNRDFYLGVPRNREDIEQDIFYPNCTAEDNVDWRLVKKTDYLAYIIKVEAYAAAVELNDAIAASEAAYPGIDLTSVKAVYNNTNSTAEELKAAQEQIADLERQYIETHISGSVDNPYDATGLIVNPTFEGAASAAAEGWTGGNVAWDSNIFEMWSQEAVSYDLYQDIANLPNGVYEVKVNALHRIAGYGDAHYQGAVLADDAQVLRTSQVYANNYWKLNNDLMDGARSEKLDSDHDAQRDGKFFPDGVHYADAAFKAGDYELSLFCAVTDGTLRIGIRCNDRKAYSWTAADNWRLTYYGAAADATDMLKANLKQNLKDYTDALVQTSLMETFEQATADLNAATDYAAVEAAYTTAMGLYYDMEKSRVAYNHYVNYVESVIPQTEGLNCDDADELADYLFGSNSDQFGGIIEERTLTPEELAAQEKWVSEKLAAAIKNTVEEGRDYTELIPNANMNYGSFQDAGWSVTWQGSAIACNCDSKLYTVGEFWEYQNFDVNVTLTEMPQGIYELAIPALYRSGDKLYDHPATSEIYVNDLSRDVMKAVDDAIEVESNDSPTNLNIYHDQWTTLEGFQSYYRYNPEETLPSDSWPYDQIHERDGRIIAFPNSTAGASVAFAAGRYVNKVYGIVGEDGKLTIGFRSKNMEGNYGSSWTVVGHITMKYMGDNQEAIDGIKEEAEAQAQNYLYSDEIFYAGYKDELQEALDQLVLANDKATLLQEIANMKAVYNKINTNIKLYAELKNLIGADNTGMYAVAVQLLEAGVITNEEANAMMSEAEEYIAGCYDGSYTNEQAQEIIDKVRSNPNLDVIYVRGGVEGVEGDDWSSVNNPLRRQADGTYKGTCKFRDERYGNMGVYAGNRSLVSFQYFDTWMSARNDENRWLTDDPTPRKLTLDTGDRHFLTAGGEWEFTINLTDSTIVCKPVGDVLYKSQIYAVGNLMNHGWDRSWDGAVNNIIAHQGNGIYQGGIVFANGVDRGEITFFYNDHWLLNDNWGEGRIGNPTDQLKVESGEETHANRFQGDRKWILDPSHHYLVTYDMNRATMRFDIRDLQGGDTEEDPLLINNFEDLLMVHTYLRQGETHYFALTADINLKGKQLPQLNGPGNESGRSYERYIHFDGRNHVLAGYEGDHTLAGEYFNSVFGVLAGTVKNLGIIGCNMSDDLDMLARYDRYGSQAMGPFAGKLGNEHYSGTTTLENCFAAGTINGGTIVGGLAGSLEGKTEVKNVFAQVDILSDGTCGGLFGRTNAGDAKVTNAYYAGEVSSNAPVVELVTDADNTAYANVANFTTNACPQATLNYDGSNFAALQQGVVAFDPTVWGCSAEADALPVLKAFEEVLTGIQSTTAGEAQRQGLIFDLQGRRIQKPARGLYIQGGHKMVVK
ncbi:MAG: hypothetical protein HUK02_06800 [Bacteroidaceae bacterium]|nr:hypothetical protein [Bacteroidaceae bacterium]